MIKVADAYVVVVRRSHSQTNLRLAKTHPTYATTITSKDRRNIINNKRIQNLQDDNHNNQA